MAHIALVSGGAGGIGKAIVRRLSRDGFTVIVADSDSASTHSFCQKMHDEGFDVQAYTLDLTSEPDVKALIESLPPLDALVNNAGIFDERHFFDVDADDFRRMYELNLIAAASLTRFASSRMRAGSKVVNIVSRAYLGARNHAHYVASKAALVGYTRACAMELAPRGVLVNAVAPGLIDTPLLRALTPERLQQQLSLQPTGSAGRPEDVANAVSFLADPEMDFITGQVLFVDGGKSLGGTLS